MSTATLTPSERIHAVLESANARLRLAHTREREVFATDMLIDLVALMLHEAKQPSATAEDLALRVEMSLDYATSRERERAAAARVPVVLDYDDGMSDFGKRVAR